MGYRRLGCRLHALRIQRNHGCFAERHCDDSRKYPLLVGEQLLHCTGHRLVRCCGTDHLRSWTGRNCYALRRRRNYMLHRQLRHRNKCACSCGQHGQADVHVRHEAASSLGRTLPLQDRAQQRHIGRLHVGNGVAVLQCRYDADCCDACN